MQINPNMREFGEITELTELTEDTQKKFEQLVEKGAVVATGPRDELKKLQDDLRKQGYKKMR